MDTGKTGGWLRKRPAYRDFGPLTFDLWNDILEPLSLFNEEKKTFSPKIDVKENEKDIVVKAELPGLKEDQVSINVTDDALVIKGEKSEEHEEKDEKNIRHYVERTYGSFQRVVALHSEVDHEKIDASFKNGVLTVVLPKTNRENKVKKISIRKE